MKRYVIAKYIRLSLEDTKYDSLSIENQRLVIDTHIAGMPESDCAEVLEFVDNGYSGTNFERPEEQRLIELVRSNRVECIIVKDLSEKDAAEAVYDIVEDDKELSVLADVFAALLEDVEIKKA